VVGAVQPVTATAAASKTVAMIRTGRMVISPDEARPVGPGFSVAGAGHGMASGQCRGNGEMVSIRSRFLIETSTPLLIETSTP
jgi:hypothetical protein